MNMIKSIFVVHIYLVKNKLKAHLSFVHRTDLVEFFNFVVASQSKYTRQKGVFVVILIDGIESPIKSYFNSIRL